MSRRQTSLAQAYSYRYGLALAAVVLLAIYFRFQALSTLPPGLSDAEATSATVALGILHHSWSLRDLLSHGPATALFSLVQAASIKLFGSTIWALRLPSVLVGIVGVVMTYLWLRSWFGRKVGLVGALLMAITPWTAGLSRLGIVGSTTVIMVPTSLWILTMAVRTRQLAWQVAGGIAIAICATGVAGLWFLLGLTAAVSPALVSHWRKRKNLLGPGLVIVAVTLVIGLPLVAIRFQHAHLQSPKVSHNSLQQSAKQVSSTVGMFNVHGDNDFHYNIAGTPELNLFVGLMFLAGLLVCAVKFNKARHRILLVLLATLLIPTILHIGDTPNSLIALIAAPVVMALAAVGIMYMLEVWYGTFPINSAARTLGTVPIVLLLTLSVYQGYRQYFVAWALSPEVYTAYNERARSLAEYLGRTQFDGQRYVLATGSDAEVVRYLTNSKVSYSQIAATDVANLPQTDKPVQIIFVTPQPTDIVPNLKQRFPKATLSQHYSAFNDSNQLFAVYQTKP